jgi:hypothetical protein
VRGDVDADFGHDFNGERVDVSGWFGPGALDVEHVAGSGAQDSFSKVAATGVACAEDENGWFVGHRLAAALVGFESGDGLKGDALGRETFVFGQACGSFEAKVDDEQIFFGLDVGDGKLGNERCLVFDVDFQIVFAEEGIGFAEDRRQLGRGEAMVGVVLEPGLQTANGFGAKCAAAIDKALVDAGDFGDVRVWRDFAADRQDEANLFAGVVSQDFF